MSGPHIEDNQLGQAEAMFKTDAVTGRRWGRLTGRYIEMKHMEMQSGWVGNKLGLLFLGGGLDCVSE
jgi:hypothetical protein